MANFTSAPPSRVIVKSTKKPLTDSINKNQSSKCTTNNFGHCVSQIHSVFFVIPADHIIGIHSIAVHNKINGLFQNVEAAVITKKINNFHF